VAVIGQEIEGSGRRERTLVDVIGQEIERWKERRKLADVIG
jgi:hypothetical protein